MVSKTIWYATKVINRIKCLKGEFRNLTQKVITLPNLLMSHAKTRGLQSGK